MRGVVERRRREVPLEALRERPLFHVRRGESLLGACAGNQRHIIAEVKKASPSKGLIRADFDPLAIAARLRGSRRQRDLCVDRRAFFSRQLACIWKQIRQARLMCRLLRKDFMLDPYQLVEAKSYGADAVLLIAAMLDAGLMGDLRAQATALALGFVGRSPHGAGIGRGRRSRRAVIGINNRNLKTFGWTLDHRTFGAADSAGHAGGMRKRHRQLGANPPGRKVAASTFF